MNTCDLTNQRFGKLTALYPIQERRRGNVVWVCKCDCGNTHEVAAVALNLGRVMSCGCLRKDKARITASKGTRTTHNLSKTNIYNCWCHMKRRCFNPQNPAYKNYGGRGITVCKEWRDNFETFYRYVSTLPHYGEEGRSIDRINNDGNYEPGNVRWATRIEQNNNRRRKRGEKVNGISA